MARRLGQDENGVPNSFLNRTRPGTSGHRNLKLISTQYRSTFAKTCPSLNGDTKPTLSHLCHLGKFMISAGDKSGDLVVLNDRLVAGEVRS